MKRFYETIYLTSSMLGAILIALNVGLQFWGYTVFLISSLLGSYLVWISNASRSLLWVHIMYAGINIIGLIRS